PTPEPEPEPIPEPEPTPEPEPVVVPPPVPAPVVAPVITKPVAPPVKVDGIYYAVQIGALGRDESAVRGEKVAETVYIVMEDGLFKHRIGKFRDLNEAINTKNSVFAKGVTDAFIVAYADGNKISVGEARKLQAGGAAPAPIAAEIPAAKAKAPKIKKKSAVFLSVQVGANVSNADPIYEIAKYENTIGAEVHAIQGAPIRYYSGEFTDKNAAEKHLSKIKGAGIETAFLVGIADGKRVSYEEALEFLAK
ncbi:MAG: hypothetical protein KDC83_08955, partial [Flavobacteriales bacterium]|nr:hypothetical protein [Flavobacteriales bacterium]